jgi:serine/threonine protein phosphatase PrpC
MQSAKNATQKGATDAPGTPLEIRRERRRSFIAQRISQDGRQRGPWCLFSGENGTSLAVTRSLGDADAARCCITVPEIISYKVKRGEDSRIILCSDGVWDTLSSTQVLKRCARRQPAAASKRICSIVKERRYNNGLGRDDITVFIIDVFPLPPAPGCAPGACSVM